MISFRDVLHLHNRLKQQYYWSVVWYWKEGKQLLYYSLNYFVSSILLWMKFKTWSVKGVSESGSDYKCNNEVFLTDLTS